MGGGAGGMSGMSGGGGMFGGGSLAAGPGVYSALDAGTMPTDFSGGGDIGAAGMGSGASSSGGGDLIGSIMGMLKTRKPSEGGASAQADAGREGFNSMLNTALSAWSGGTYSGKSMPLHWQGAPTETTQAGRLTPMTTENPTLQALMAILRGDS